MWKNFTNFNGRTNIPGYWWAFLANFIVSTVLGLIGLGTIYGYIALVPGLAMCIRRLNDAGKKWYWIFISFVPLAGVIILIVLLCKPSVDTYIEAPNPVEF